MPTIRNSSLFKKFTDFFRLKTNDFLDSEAGRMLVPVINLPIPPNTIILNPTEAQLANGIAVPAGRKWKIKIISFSWTSDVTVGNRNILIEMWNRDIVNLIYNSMADDQAASLERRYSFSDAGVRDETVGKLARVLPLPSDLVLYEGDTIFIFDNSGIAAGDTLTLSTLIVEESTILEDEREIRTL